mgnify:CR=1 FL=1
MNPPLSWVKFIAAFLAIMIVAVLSVFYLTSIFSGLVGLAVGVLFVAFIGTFVYEYYTDIKRDFGDFGLSIGLWFSQSRGVGLWMPKRKITTDPDGTQIGATGIKHVPLIALDCEKPIQDEPTIDDLVFWRWIPLNVKSTFMVAKYVGEYTRKYRSEYTSKSWETKMPKFKVLFAQSML